jgi:hypothetical protein
VVAISDLEEFLAAINADAGQLPRVRTLRQRQGAIRAADRELAKDGI